MTHSKKRNQPLRTDWRRWLLWSGIGGFLGIVVAIAVWRHYFHRYTPLDALADLRAGAQAGHSPHPAQQFLELRYGPQSDPENRKKAFIDLFNAGHIEGLNLIVRNRSNARTKALVGDVANIIADYRKNMTPSERADLKAYFDSPAGREQIRDATDSFQSKSAQFRSVSTPVIQEVLATLTTLSQ